MTHAKRTEANRPRPESQSNREVRSSARPIRIALYSHDTMGIGHMRRNLLIAQTLSASPLNASVLIIAGAREAGAFELPPGVDCLTLPALRKEQHGGYGSRSLDISLGELRELRSNVIHAAVKSYNPDVFIVDKVPRGAGGELDQTLRTLRSSRRTRCVLGLRDVLDDPTTVRREWKQADNDRVIDECYDTVWVYGDQQIYDPVREYRFRTNIAAKIRYTGYLDQRERLKFTQPDDSDAVKKLNLPPGRLVLGVVGGGQDGVSLATAFSQSNLPEQMNAVLVCGPLMPAEDRKQLIRAAAGRPRFRVLEFETEPDWLMSRAERVVAMGGYNTLCSVLSFQKPALIVPRVKPRLEQWIRARRLKELGLLNLIHPDDLTSETLGQWLSSTADPPLDRSIPRRHERPGPHSSFFGGTARPIKRTPQPRSQIGGRSPCRIVLPFAWATY